MLTTLISIFLSLFNTGAVITAQVTTCEWPNPCRGSVVEVAQITTCDWPNPCGTKLG